MSEPEGNTLVKPLFVVAVASSAGGLSALSQLLSPLTPGFPAAIVIVQHLSPRHASFLADILSRRTLLKVKQAETGDHLSAGVIYTAPPDWHVLVTPKGMLSLSQSEPLHFLRPSADLLFDSLANSYKDHAVAVVLTGTGKDGSEGIKRVKLMGGVVIVQSQATSEFTGMPSAAIQTGYVDYVLPLNEIAAFLENLVTVGKIE